MKLEDQVVSVELAKELKELGVKQNSEVAWLYYTETSLSERDWKQLSRKEFGMEEFKWGLNCELCKRVDYIDSCSAPTVAELGEMLPDGFYSYYDEFDGWFCSSPWGFCDLPNPHCEMLAFDTFWGLCTPARQRRYTEEAKTEADARAKMLIFLIKAGLINVEEAGKRRKDKTQHGISLKNVNIVDEICVQRKNGSKDNAKDAKKSMKRKSMQYMGMNGAKYER